MRVSGQIEVFSAILVMLLMAACVSNPAAVTVTDERIVIAHRGASGYLPEHTIAAKAMAFAQGADFIEQDLVMTRDDELVVLHDHYLDTVTNVSTVFPHRAREDGRYYVIDFTLDEIRQLLVTERFELRSGEPSAVFPARFPLNRATFRVHTFAEEIELILGLNRSTGRAVGLYPEIKSPAFHREAGKDISAAVLDVLASYGFRDKQDPVFLQCFDPHELLRIHRELLPARNMQLPLVQLIGTSPQFAPLLTAEGIQHISQYAVAIGPSMHLLVDKNSVAGKPQLTGLATAAKAAGLKMHPYTFRREAEQIPSYAGNLQELLDIFFNQVGVDGVFTDFPDLAVQYLETSR
tara:strand:- start:9654 stop:10703 length:1050 start_codon:yes stop_codon:yes gene_type:complete